MKFREGLLYTYQNRRTDGEITDPFYLYCRLSDLCSSEYADKEKVELFYAIDRRLCIFETLIKEGKKGEKTLLNSYMVVSELLSEGSFQKLIECAVWVMSPTAKMPDPTPKNIPKPTYQPPQRAQKITPVKVEKAEESVKKETKTYLKSSSYAGPGRDVEIFIGVAAFFIIISLCMIVLGILTAIFGWNIPWRAWQWVVGILGGGWLMGILAFAVYIVDDAIVCDYPMAGFIAMLAAALVNVTLLLFLQESYKVVFSCVSVWMILGGGLLSIFCFDDVEYEWGWACLVAVAVILVGMIAALIWV